MLPTILFFTSLVLLCVFRPIIIGSFKAVFVLFVPRKSFTQRVAEQSYKNSSSLYRMAKQYEHFSPNQAKEICDLASRS